MRPIPLHNTNLFAMVDDEDEKELLEYTWYLQAYSNKRRYRSIARYSGSSSSAHIRGSLVLMNRHILGIDDPTIRVRHRDGNPLNCQKSNLIVIADGYAVRRLRAHWLRNLEIRFKFPR